MRVLATRGHDNNKHYNERNRSDIVRYSNISFFTEVKDHQNNFNITQRQPQNTEIRKVANTVHGTKTSVPFFLAHQ